MKNKKLIIALVSISIIVAVSVVGVTYAVWDITSANNNFDITIGKNLNLNIIEQTNEDITNKYFAPVSASDVTSAVNILKLASFKVVTTTTGSASKDEKLEFTTVNAKFKVFDGETNITKYFDLYILNETEYSSYVDGTAIDASKKLANDMKINHSVSGVLQGVVLAWKAEYIANSNTENKTVITALVGKSLKVTLDFTATPTVVI